MSDEMARSHREDSRAERDFRELARHINTVRREHEQRLGRTGFVALSVALNELKARADHLVEVWD